MAIQKLPRADAKRWYPIDRQIGMLLSLSLVLGAFTVPLPEESDEAMLDTSQEVIEIEEVVDQTRQYEPPPPPPAPPPPQEVPDNVEVEEAIVDEVELDLEMTVSVPLAPPPPPARPVAPPTPAAPPPPPPPPPEAEQGEDEIFEVVEVQPELIGGLEGLQARLVYPELARLANIDGTVIVQCVVDERGNVTSPVALRSPSPVLSEAALKAVAESRFTPGMQRGRPVRVRFVIPVRFELRGPR